MMTTWKDKFQTTLWRFIIFLLLFDKVTSSRLVFIWMEQKLLNAEKNIKVNALHAIRERVVNRTRTLPLHSFVSFSFGPLPPKEKPAKFVDFYCNKGINSCSKQWNLVSPGFQPFRRFSRVSPVPEATRCARSANNELFPRPWGYAFNQTFQRIRSLSRTERNTRQNVRLLEAKRRNGPAAG